MTGWIDEEWRGALERARRRPVGDRAMKYLEGMARQDAALVRVDLAANAPGLGKHRAARIEAAWRQWYPRYVRTLVGEALNGRPWNDGPELLSQDREREATRRRVADHRWRKRADKLRKALLRVGGPVLASDRTDWPLVRDMIEIGALAIIDGLDGRVWLTLRVWPAPETGATPTRRDGVVAWAAGASGDVEEDGWIMADRRLRERHIGPKRASPRPLDDGWGDV